MYEQERLTNWRKKQELNWKKEHSSRSKERLYKSIKKKLETTFIGAISDCEEWFGEMWGHKKENLTPQEKEFYEMWMELRKAVLGRGNAQIRMIEKELEQYSVEYVGQKINMLTKKKED